MPATLVPRDRIPALAAEVKSPLALRILRRLREVGFIQNHPALDRATLAALGRFTELGLVDAGYAGEAAGQPFVWVLNGNGERVLDHFDASPGDAPQSRVKINARARTALASLTEPERLTVLSVVETLQAQGPESWPTGQVAKLAPEEPVYLVTVSEDLRAFVHLRDGGELELSDIVREATLKLFLERYGAGSKAG